MQSDYDLAADLPVYRISVMQIGPNRFHYTVKCDGRAVAAFELSTSDMAAVTSVQCVRVMHQHAVRIYNNDSTFAYCHVDANVNGLHKIQQLLELELITKRDAHNSLMTEANTVLSV